MARILLCWELGANLGHVAPLRMLAREFRQRGHDCVFAASDLRSAEEMIEPALGPVLQAPVRVGTPRNLVKVQISFASLLNNSGFDDIIGLAARIRAWRTLFVQQQPDLVVCDHSPTALVAARSLGLASANVGFGFIVPPLRQPFPVFQPNLQVKPDVLAHNEAAVLQNLNHALARLQLPPLERLQEIFSHASGYVLSYAELDHYEGGRDEPYLGLPDTAHGAPPVWPPGEGPRLLAYLRASKTLESVLTALSRSNARVLLRVGDVPAAKLQGFIRPGLVITDQPVHMRLAMQDCQACINYASHGFTAEMLLAGKPGLLLPDHLERSLVARRAGQLGAALSPPAEGSFNLSEALVRIVEDPALRQGAEKFAQKYRSQDRSRIPSDLADELLKRFNLPARAG